MSYELDALWDQIKTNGFRLGPRGRQILEQAAQRLQKLEQIADPSRFQVFQVNHPDHGPLPIEDERVGLQVSMMITDLENRAMAAEDALKGLLHAKGLQEVEIRGDKFHVPPAVANWIKQAQSDQNRMPSVGISLEAVGSLKMIPNRHLPKDTVIVAQEVYDRLSGKDSTCPLCKGNGKDPLVLCGGITPPDQEKACPMCKGSGKAKT